MARSLAGLALAAAVAFALLLARTPPAGEAVALARAQAARHAADFPGLIPPRRFTEALVATEDHRFFSPFDPGLDPFAVGRVILGEILRWRDQGGSTIEQQLAKMLYTPHQRGLAIKLEQVAIALKLSFTYTKPEILALYSAVVYFGNGYYGLDSASCGYFGEQAAKLSWTQAAMLAGILNGPSIFNPRRNLAAAREREAHVFKRLVAVGDLTQAEAKAALAKPLGLLPAARNSHSSCS